MKNGCCPKCSSTDVYVSTRALGDSGNTLLLKGDDLFELNTYLCIRCGYVESYASERSVTLFGRSKPLDEVIPASQHWRRAAN